MQRFTLASVFHKSSVFFLSAVLGASAIQAQVQASSAPVRPVANRLTAPVVESARVTLPGTVHPMTRKAKDDGAVADATRLDRIQIVLKRSDAQESGLKRLIGDLHTQGSASYHKWLTPEEFGKQFGPSDVDVATLESWLTAKGFRIEKMNAGRQTLEVSGTSGQLRDAFHTQMHRYEFEGGTRLANTSDPDVPAALAPVFGGFVSLNNFRFKSHAQVLGHAQFNPVTHESKPDWTIGSSTRQNFVLAPGDFNVQYNLGPVYAAGTKGDGQAIAIVNGANINVAQVNLYRSLFGLPVNPPKIIVDGTDPGIDGINSPYGPNNFSVEAYLDVELAGAVAPNAEIDLVIANDTATSDGLTLALEHAVYSNVAPVVSLSFGSCEASQGSYNGFISSLWEQAAAQGQTVLVSTGDAGSAGCDNDNAQYFAVQGQAVNGLASTPYNVAVGGTDFYYSGGTSTVGNYWNLTPTNSTPTVSLTAPIPEQPWNDSQYGLNLFSEYATNGTTLIAGGGGGASTAGLATGPANNPTYVPYPKPSWQSGTGVPADKARDLPDVSLFAANGLNNSYYPVCASDADCQPSSFVQISGIGGTSASTPAFAGMMALVNQRYGRQGQANYILYPLATQFPSAFHDVTVGTISVPCATTTVTDQSTGRSIAPKNCISVSNPLTVTDPTYGQTVEGQIGFTAGKPAYDATAGYDLATGLGTIDASNLIANWNKVTLAATTTTLAPTVAGAPATSFAHGTTVTISGKVSGGTSPAGDVALVTTSTDPNNQGEALFTLASGAYTGTVSYLPGGTYTIYGSYPGDSSNAPSTSTPVQITVTPEASTTTLNIYSFLGNPPTSVSSGSTVSYGSETVLSALPAAAAGTTTAPTGTVSFLDGTASVNTAVLDANGEATYNAAFAIGTHAVTATYSGDGSYGGSTSAATGFTVAKNTPNVLVTYSNQDQNNNPVNGQVTYLMVQVQNSVNISGPALAPTGTVTLTGGPAGTTTSATLVSSVDPRSGLPQGLAYFAIPATASGPYSLTFAYGGDTNYATTLSGPTTYQFDTGAGTVATTTTATASPAATSSTGLVSLSATVKAASGSAAPTGDVQLISSGYLLAQATLPASTTSSATVQFLFDHTGLLQGTNQITVQYFPKTAGFGSSAAVVSVVNSLSDFSLVPAAAILNVPSTGTQTDVINLTSYGGFAGAVGVTCKAPSGVTCSLSALAANLAVGGQSPITLTVNTTAVAAAGTYSVSVTGTDSTGKIVHTVAVQVVTPAITTVASFSLTGTPLAVSAPGGSGTSTITATPANGFVGDVALTCAVTATPIGGTGTPTCALSPATASITGTAAATSMLTVSTGSTTTGGVYTVTVTGTAGSLTRTVDIAVTVTGTAGGGGGGTFTLAGTPVTIASQGASGTSTITATPAGGFTGAVALTCSVTSAPSGAITANNPTCSATSVSVTGTTAATATLTINTTAQTATLDMPFKRLFTTGGGVALGTLLLLGVPVGRRRKQWLKAIRAIHVLSVLALFALVAGAGIGCGSGSGGGSTPPPTGGTTTGSYTLTVTGTSGATTATTTVAVTVN